MTRNGKALIASAALALATCPVSAATFAPANVSELVAAINTANANGEDDSIDLGGGTITLSAVDNVLDGPNGLPGVLADGGRSLTIRNGAIERAWSAWGDLGPAFRLLHVAAGATLLLDTVTLQNGTTGGIFNQTSDGGAVLNHGRLSITGCFVARNAALPSGNGGAVANSGVLSVERSTFYANGTLSGGAAIANFGEATITASSFRSNLADSGGGAILNSGVLSVTDTSFLENVATDSGGAIDNYATFLLVRNCTFSGNRSIRGAAIHNSSVVRSITNTTIVRNTSSFDFIGGAGLYNRVSGQVLELAANIIAANVATTAPDIVNEGSIVSASDNVLGVGDGSGIVNGVNGNQVGSLAAPLDPLLGPLADNGGPTLTHALLAGSPAIDRGSNPAALAYDQRGVGFARVSGARADIGAFELQSADLSVAKVDTPDPVLAGASVTWTVTVQNTGPDTAMTVALSDPLPAVTTFVSVSAPAGWSCSSPAVGTNGTVSCSIASLPVGSAVFTIVAAVGAATPLGTVISNTATVTSVTPDPGSANNSATATTTVASPALLSATKAVSGNFAPGGNVTYTIVLRNTGPGTQLDNPGNELIDVLPAELALVSATATSGTAVATLGTNTVTWNGSIPAGGTVTITIGATVRATTPLGTSISNQATIAYDLDGNGTNEASSVSDDPATAAGGDPTAFSVLAASVTTVPVLGGFGLLAMAALVGAAGLAVRPR